MKHLTDELAEEILSNYENGNRSDAQRLFDKLTDQGKIDFAKLSEVSKDLVIFLTLQ